LARLARSAASLACASATSVFLRSVMSRTVAMQVVRDWQNLKSERLKAKTEEVAEE
jgi:hypothetical protein